MPVVRGMCNGREPRSSYPPISGMAVISPEISDKAIVRHRSAAKLAENARTCGASSLPPRGVYLVEAR